MSNKISHRRRLPQNQHARLGQAMKNDVCPYCACRINKVTWTKEHMLPEGLTGSRRYDFMACRNCNNEKSALDDVAITVSRLGAWSPHLQAGFDKMINSSEGCKSLVAVLRHFNLETRRELSDEGDLGMEGDDKTILDFFGWLKWVARGLYFLETGQCLKPKEKHRSGCYFIHPSMLNPREMTALRNGEIPNAEQILSQIDRWRHLPETQTFGEGSVCLWCESIEKTGAIISFGGWYTFAVKVNPYSKTAFLDSANKQLRYFSSPDVKRLTVVDLKMVNGKEALILEKTVH